MYLFIRSFIKYFTVHTKQFISLTSWMWLNINHHTKTGLIKYYLPSVTYQISIKHPFYLNIRYQLNLPSTFPLMSLTSASFIPRNRNRNNVYMRPTGTDVQSTMQRSCHFRLLFVLCLAPQGDISIDGVERR